MNTDREDALTRETGRRAVEQEISDPELIGQTLTLDYRPHTVIGVMPEHFQFPGRDQEFWVPMAFEPEEAAGRGDHYLTVVARLRPGVTIAQAQAEMDDIAARLEQQYPRTNTEQGVALVLLRTL